MDFSAEANTFVAYAADPDNESRLMLSPVLTTLLTATLGEWNTIIALYIDPVTHYSVIKDVQDTYKSFDLGTLAIKLNEYL